MSNSTQSLPIIPHKDDILTIARAQIAAHQNAINDITNSIQLPDATFSNVILPLTTLENHQSGQKATILALRYGAPDKETQDIVEQAAKLWTEYENAVYQRRDLFKLVQCVKERGGKVDSESERLLDRILLNYSQRGQGADEESLRAWSARNVEIDILRNEFNMNCRQTMPPEVFFTTEQLAGLSEDVINKYPVVENKRRILLTRQEHGAIQQYVHDANVRKAAMAAWGQRIPQNIAIFRKIILLRDQNARVLGYQSHAESRLPYRMAPSVERVDQILDSLSQTLLPERKRAFNRMLDKKRAVLKTSDENVKLETYDVAYYGDLLKQSLDLDENEVMEYFTLEYTFPAILDIFASYLQLRFEKVENVAGHVWHDSVMVWSVWDEREEHKGAFIGYLYADMEERPNKYKGNQAVNLQPVSFSDFLPIIRTNSLQCYVDERGHRIYAATTLMCNFAPSTAHGVILLKHWQIKTLFHGMYPPLKVQTTVGTKNKLELSHCMHDLLSRNKYAKLHAFEACIEFGEAIGTMTERWSWMKDVLQRISRHYTRLAPEHMDSWKALHPGRVPPEIIPEELVDALLAHRNESRVDLYLDQMYVPFAENIINTNTILDARRSLI